MPVKNADKRLDYNSIRQLMFHIISVCQCSSGPCAREQRRQAAYTIFLMGIHQLHNLALNLIILPGELDLR